MAGAVVGQNVVYNSQFSGQILGGGSQGSSSGGSTNKGRIVPNPNGKKGCASHQKVINEIANDIEERGLTPEFEYKYDTSGGTKNIRYADVVGLDGQGRVAEIHQVGISTKKHGAPVSREKKQLEILGLQKIITRQE